MNRKALHWNISGGWIYSWQLLLTLTQPPSINRDLIHKESNCPTVSIIARSFKHDTTQPPFKPSRNTPYFQSALILSNCQMMGVNIIIATTRTLKDHAREGSSLTRHRLFVLVKSKPYFYQKQYNTITDH